jgi:hypothetical protein
MARSRKDASAPLTTTQRLGILEWRVRTSQKRD